MWLEIFEDGFYMPAKVATSSTNKLVTFTYLRSLIYSLDGKKKKKKEKVLIAVFILKEMLSTWFPKVGCLSQWLWEFTSLHIKQQKMDIADKEYPGSAQR